MFIQQLQQQGMALPPQWSPDPAVAQQHAMYEVGGLHPNGNALSSMSSDFVMYTWKTAECSKKYCHDWAVCPFAHPNENSRRRSPRVFAYSATICQQMKQNRSCSRGDACDMSHSVHEFWLHPDKFHTEFCRMGNRCSRRMCFFAHTREELRIPNPSNRPEPSSTQGTLPAPAQVAPAAAPPAAAPPAACAGGPGAEPCLQDSRPVVLQAPPMLAAPTATQSDAQHGRRSTASGDTPFAGTVPVLQSSAGVLSCANSSISTPTSLQQGDTMLLPAFRPQHNNTNSSSGPYLAGNRHQRRQHLQPGRGGGKGAVGSPSDMIMAHQAAAQGLQPYPAGYPSHPSTAQVAPTIAQLQAQLANLGMPSAPAALYGHPALSAPALLGNFGGAGMLPMQRLTLAQGLHGLQYNIGGFNAQPVAWAGGMGQVSTAGGGQYLMQQQRAPAPLSIAAGPGRGGAGYGVMSAGQGHPGAGIYQPAPATASMQSYAMGGNSMMDPRFVQQMMAGQMGGQAAPPVSAAAGGAPFGLPIGTFMMQ